MKQVALKYGPLCGLVYIIISLVSILLGLGEKPNMMLGLLVALIILVATYYVIHLGVKEFRDVHNDNVLSIGQGVKLGVMIALIAGVLAALFNLLYFKVIDPGLLEEQFEQARFMMEEQGMADEQIDLSMKITRIMQSPPVAILYTTFWGLIKGLIAGAILQRHKAPQ